VRRVQLYVSGADEKNQLSDQSVMAQLFLELPFDRRCISRQLVVLSDGTEAGLFLPRGTVMRGADRLIAEDGTAIGVRAANQALIRVTARNPLAMVKAAYHLGNRHIPVQVANDFLQLEYDYVLLDMLKGLGVEAHEVLAPFEPEGGAYAAHAGHAHAH
jgi:urease accessory protein